MTSLNTLIQPRVNADGAVVVCATGARGGDPRSHEKLTYNALAKRLAAIKGCAFAGDFDACCHYSSPLYFVPSDTLSSLEHAHVLGIYDEQDFFGGVVPYPFAATKIITHALVEEDAYAPVGWSPDFAGRVRNVVLHGFSAFTVDDAWCAGKRLLEMGSVRIKQPRGIGGLGQMVVTRDDELRKRLQSCDSEDLLRDGLVLEQNLSSITTCSIGQVRVDELIATYCGTQSQTASNHGESVYGGSNLLLVRGGFETLLRLDLDVRMRTAIAQACAYHATAMTAFSGMFASRCNYDVAQGWDEQGRWRSGVLEQSWRIGGASGAEVAALEAFHADPALHVVRASTTEIYGETYVLPWDATVYFDGVDERAGKIVKYSRLTRYEP